MSEEQIDTSVVGAEEFARSIAQTTDAQLAEGMSGPLRGQILDEVFKRMAEHAKPDKIGATEAVVHWRIGGRAGGGEDVYETVIRNGTVTVNEQPEATPRLTMRIDGVDFLKLVTGNQSGPGLFMTGKLKLEGDIMFAASMASMFRVPGAGPQPGAGAGPQPGAPGAGPQPGGTTPPQPA
jgi:putative sterol carrier protein